MRIRYNATQNDEYLKYIFYNYSRRKNRETRVAVYAPKIRRLVISLVSRKEKSGRGWSRRDTRRGRASVIVLFLITARRERSERCGSERKSRARGEEKERRREAEACLPLRYAVNNKRL